ncbi:hypothetical protein [Anaerocellum danielii]|uniref:Uncharacterized protein n=1 Tax=Anaerocellum danielii TaxID=1387557 RepID=A0ABZ0U1W0_9FIRM|nr:hypothetical protein [Caldicellulosiruptor danielii]WPX09092.1 hypothetical protein SOJ16_000266 [Caldicellulosiruptor danielii]
MKKINFAGYLFEPQKNLETNLPKYSSHHLILCFSNRLIVTAKKDIFLSSSNKIDNIWIYEWQKNKTWASIYSYKPEILVDRILKIDDNKKLLYALAIDEKKSEIYILEIDIINKRENIICKNNLYNAHLKENNKVIPIFSVEAKELSSRFLIFSVEPMDKFDISNYKSVFIFDIENKSLYQLPSQGQNFLNELEIQSTGLYNDKYILFKTGKIGDCEKLDIVMDEMKKEDFDPKTLNVKQQIYILPFEQFLMDLKNNQIEFSRHLVDFADYEAVLTSSYLGWFENDCYYYVKTYTKQDKSVLIRVKFSEKGITEKEVIYSFDERIISNSIFTTYQILDSGKIKGKELFYIVKSFKSNKPEQLEIFYFGDKTKIKRIEPALEENESIYLLNLRKNFFITATAHFNLEEPVLSNHDKLLLTYKLYLLSTQKLIDRLDFVHMCYNIFIYENPDRKDEILIYFY